jgi:hypothetical protein
VVNEGTLYVSDGSIFSVRSDLTNSNDGTVHNNGTLVIQGDFVNSNEYNGDGALQMDDHSTYTSLEMAGDTIATLILSESEYTYLSQDLFISDSIIFSGGHFLLNGFTLTLPDTIGFRGYSSSSHIATNSGKIVLSGFDNVDGVTLPLSYNTDVGYNPLTFSNSGAMDNFSIEMTDSATEDGTRSGVVNTSSDMVDAMWIIGDELDAAYSVDLTLNWTADEERSSFDNTNAGLAVYENGAWSLNSSNLGDLSSRTVSKTGITDIDDLALAIADGESDFISSGLLFSLKIFLEGPYNSTNDNMDNGLNGIIPNTATSAYASAHNYSGSESFASVPSSAVDWVLVELRDASTAAGATSSTVVDTVAGLLLQDGSIVASDGISNLSFEGLSLANNPFVVIYHRNHLAVMSASAISESNGVFTYDFTTTASQAYGDGLVELESGVYGMLGGDVNQDGSIIYNGGSSDRVEILNLVGTSTTSSPSDGYLSGDINMDASAIYNGANSDRVLILNQVGTSTTSSPVTGNVPN